MTQQQKHQYQRRELIVEARMNSEITWYNKFQWRECVFWVRGYVIMPFPRGFLYEMKTLFDYDWEGRANRSQHTHHGKHGWYQFKGNIFTITMMSIYEMSLYYLVLSCISYSTQIHQHSCSWYFINIITIIVWAVCSDNSHSPPRWKNISSIITSLSVHALRPVYISSLSLVHLYLSCVDGGSLTVEVGLSNVRRQMNVHLFNITHSTLRHISFH